MEREKIIKALEICVTDDCNGCPYFGKVPCTNPLKTDALSLIKELTEENERLQQTIARVKKYCQTLKIRIPPMSVVTYIEQIEKEFLEAKE